MIDPDRLKVSLTKNGYFKVAALFRRYSRWEICEHLEGDHDGIDIKPSQVKNMLDMNPTTGEIPDHWDSIRDYGPHTIDAFAVVAMLFSHGRLIRLMQAASQGRDEFTGYFLRTDFGQEKEFTNFAYSLGCFGLSDYRRGASAVEYNLAPVVWHLRNDDKESLVRSLLRTKLLRMGWSDPERNPLSADRPLMEELRHHAFNRVLSMEWPRFAAWLEGTLDMVRPIQRFGLHDVKLFDWPMPND